MKKAKVYFATLVSILFGGSCGDASEHSTALPDLSEATQIEYRFGDTSLPPDYHRSYTITITETSKSITVDSYGDILLSRNYPNSSASFTDFKEELSKKGIAKHDKVDAGGCSGGTTESIRVCNDKECFFDAYVYHCEGAKGTLYLPAGVSDMFLQQIPEDVNSLIESTKINK
ncbi:MAG: hypothetical protein IJ200_10435 [Prevotella sp.]|nr:hypothetical protein [Prevotella sp.]